MDLYCIQVFLHTKIGMTVWYFFYFNLFLYLFFTFLEVSGSQNLLFPFLDVQNLTLCVFMSVFLFFLISSLTTIFRRSAQFSCASQLLKYLLYSIMILSAYDDHHHHHDDENSV